MTANHYTDHLNVTGHCETYRVTGSKGSTGSQQTTPWPNPNPNPNPSPYPNSSLLGMVWLSVRDLRSSAVLLLRQTANGRSVLTVRLASPARDFFISDVLRCT